MRVGEGGVEVANAKLAIFSPAHRTAAAFDVLRI